MIKVLFFARIREQLGLDQLQVEVSEHTDTLGKLTQYLAAEKGAPWGEVLMADNVVKAINQDVAEDGQGLDNGDEVAFFPPVTGG